MKKRNMITSILLAITLSTGMAFSSLANAHERDSVKRITVIKSFKNHDDDRWYLKRHREARGHWAPAKKRHHKRHRKHLKKQHRRHRNKHYRVERRYYDAPRRHKHHDDGLQVHIGYELWL